MPPPFPFPATTEKKKRKGTQQRRLWAQEHTCPQMQSEVLLTDPSCRFLFYFQVLLRLFISQRTCLLGLTTRPCRLQIGQTTFETGGDHPVVSNLASGLERGSARATKPPAIRESRGRVDAVCAASAAASHPKFATTNAGRERSRRFLSAIRTSCSSPRSGASRTRVVFHCREMPAVE